ncbi:MAG: PD40 domain-containing protein [Gemmatimonadaceae bacterium]|nr:PD40 domain-containing protein [Gemmatimonadaceae bacterium]
MSMPSAFGNLIIERGGTYRMSSSRARAAAFRFDPARGAVTFAGLLAPFANTYGTRGKDLFFDFASRAISFSCALTTTVDRGNAQGQRQAPAGTTATPAARTPLQGTLYFAGRTGLQKLTLTDGTQATLSSTWQFDVRGTEVLLVDATGALRITNEDGAGSRPVPVYGTGNQAPRFSPDGRRIVLLGSQPPTSVAAAIIGATTSADLEPLIVGRDGRVIAAFGSPYTQPAWTPDGRLVMAGAKARGSLAGNAATGIFLSGASGSAVRRIDPGFDAPHSPAVSADGRVAFVNGTRIWVMPLSGANPPARLAEGSSPGIGALAWSPDGRSLAFADGDVVKVVMPDGRVVPVQDAAGNGVRSTGPLVWR